MEKFEGRDIGLADGYAGNIKRGVEDGVCPGQLSG